MPHVVFERVDPALPSCGGEQGGNYLNPGCTNPKRRGTRGGRARIIVAVGWGRVLLVRLLVRLLGWLLVRPGRVAHLAGVAGGEEMGAPTPQEENTPKTTCDRMKLLDIQMDIPG